MKMKNYFTSPETNKALVDETKRSIEKSKEQKFNLSEMRFRCGGTKKVIRYAYKEDNVKDFICWLKTDIMFLFENEDECEIEDFYKIIDNLAGRKLI